MLSGTRPAVVEAVIHGLLDAGVPPEHIIIWDKHESDLRAAGFFKLGAQLNVRAAGSAEAGYDPTNFYLPDTAIIGNLVWGDLNSGKKAKASGENPLFQNSSAGKSQKSSASRRCSIEETTGVCGHLFSLALGSVDNTMRFEDDPDGWPPPCRKFTPCPCSATASRSTSPTRSSANTKAAIARLLHYSSVLNQLWFSRDPVALDTLAIKELDRERRTFEAPEFKPNLELYTNAALLQLGVNNPAKIQVEKLR